MMMTMGGGRGRGIIISIAYVLFVNKQQTRQPALQPASHQSLNRGARGSHTRQPRCAAGRAYASILDHPVSCIAHRASRIAHDGSCVVPPILRFNLLWPSAVLDSDCFTGFHPSKRVAPLTAIPGFL
jgi:hypothetical protein